MQVVKLSPNHTKQVEQFCIECKLAGYTNNSSLELMKWGDQYDLAKPAQWWGLIEQDKILSVSGCHEIQDQKLRCLFRSATLPKYQKLITGLSRNHMNSVPFSLLLPYQIHWGLEQGYTEFYITTSSGKHDASGKMHRTHRALQLLEYRGIVELVDQQLYYSTPQTVWRIRLDKYFKARAAAQLAIAKIING